MGVERSEVALSTSWETKPLPPRVASLPFQHAYTAEEFAILARGLIADFRERPTCLVCTQFCRRTGWFSTVLTVSDVWGASPYKQDLRTSYLLRAWFPSPSF